jgi:hypothetical protein
VPRLPPTQSWRTALEAPGVLLFAVVNVVVNDGIV